MNFSNIMSPADSLIQKYALSRRNIGNVSDALRDSFNHTSKSLQPHEHALYIQLLHIIDTYKINVEGILEHYKDISDELLLAKKGCMETLLQTNFSYLYDALSIIEQYQEKGTLSLAIDFPDAIGQNNIQLSLHKTLDASRYTSTYEYDGRNHVDLYAYITYYVIEAHKNIGHETEEPYNISLGFQLENSTKTHDSIRQKLKYLGVTEDSLSDIQIGEFNTDMSVELSLPGENGKYTPTSEEIFSWKYDALFMLDYLEGIINDYPSPVIKIKNLAGEK